MELRGHVERIEEEFTEVAAAVEEFDRASGHPLVRLLVLVGVHPDTDALDRGADRLGTAVDGLREAVWGPDADLEDAVQSAAEGPTDDWEQRRLEVLRRDDWTCRNCGRKGGPTGDADLHAHHVVPVARGGRTEDSNLVTLCERCHVRAHGG